MASQLTSTQFDLPADRSMLDAVTFVATLVSKPDDIDPQLDRIRAITATRMSHQLTTTDNQILREVYDYLEDYLVEKERLRSFTREAIRERVYDYLHGEHRANLVRALSVIWGIAVGGVSAVVVIPEMIIPSTIRMTLGIAIFFVTMHLGAAWMFWTGLRNFKDQARWAYMPIWAGVAMIGLTMLQVPVAAAIGQYDSLWFRYGTSGLFIMVAVALIYIGVRRFAALSSVASRLMSVKVVAGICVGASIVMSILPAPCVGCFWMDNDHFFFILTSGAVISFVIVRIVNMTRQSLSQVYKRPMAWFAASMVVSGITFAQFSILQVIAAPGNAYEKQDFATLPLVISAFVLLKAGTSFRRIDTTIVRADKSII